MTQITGGRWDTFIRRLFNIKALPIAPSIAPEIAPSIAVENESSAELDYLRNIQRWSCSATTAAVAGQLAQTTLQNNTPDYIIILEAFVIFSAALTRAKLGFDATPVGPAPQQRSFVDGREVLLDVTRRPVAQIVTSSNVGTALTQGFVEIPVGNNALFQYNFPWVIGPQQRLILEGSFVNQGFTVVFWGRSRPIESTED